MEVEHVISGEFAPTEMPEKYRPRTVHAVTHAVDLLRLLSASPAPMSLSVLSRKIGLSKPSTYNLLNTLISERLVSKSATSLYSLAWGVFELGARVIEIERLRRTARFAVDALAEVSEGVALLSVLRDQSVFYLDRGQVDFSFTVAANVGNRSPLHTNASGKVLLASMDDQAVSHYVARPLSRRTTATITEPRILIGELGRVRSDGFGFCRGEQEPALSSVAVPIAIGNGDTLASLAVAVPSARLRRRYDTEQLLAKLQKSAQDIEASWRAAA